MTKIQFIPPRALLDLLIALETAVVKATLSDEVEISGSNLYEFFSDLMSKHPEPEVGKYFQTVLDQLEGKHDG
jgi:hypothetical protein